VLFFMYYINDSKKVFRMKERSYCHYKERKKLYKTKESVMDKFFFAIVNFVTNFIVSYFETMKKWMGKIATYRFYRWMGRDGVRFYLVSNFRQLAEVLINGGFMTSEDAKDWICTNGINFAVGFTFSIDGVNFMFIPKELGKTVYGLSMAMHEISHIKNHHVEKILHGDYKGLESEVICGQVVVYNFEAQADAYALKRSGHLFYESEESMALFKELYKKCSLKIIADIEVLYNVDLSMYKTPFEDGDFIETVMASMNHQIEMRKKLLPKYL